MTSAGGFNFILKDKIIKSEQRLSYKLLNEDSKDEVNKMAVPTGIEPAISCVTGRHVNRYTTGPVVSKKFHLILYNILVEMAAEGIEPPTLRV